MLRGSTSRRARALVAGQRKHRAASFTTVEIADGTIVAAVIVPPTAQKQASIENDVRTVLAANLDLSDEALTWRCEQAIRNHEPFISCATHFLKIDLDRTWRPGYPRRIARAQQNELG